MSKKAYKIFSLLLCFCLVFEQVGFAQSIGQLDISGYLTGLHNSFTQDKFRPLHLRYLRFNPQQDGFSLLVDKGDTKYLADPAIEESTKELMKYFFVGLTLSNDSFWVNLRPDSPDNIIDDQLAQTDVGRILLEADLQLKKDTARFTSPENPEGKEYWDKLYQKAGEIFGSENITIPTLTRPWIVPDEIIIREAEDNIYIYKATLKVMLEQDYLKDSSTYNFKDGRLKELNEYSSRLIRELIIPKITEEVNTAKRYAPLRQVYYSLILAQWFKQRFLGRGGYYSQIIDRKDLTGLTSKDPYSKETYFLAYQKSFKDGEYSIKKPRYTPYGQTIRSYFSGGITATVLKSTRAVPAVEPMPNQRPYLRRADCNGPLDNLGVRMTDEPKPSWLPGTARFLKTPQNSGLENGAASLTAKKEISARLAQLQIIKDKKPNEINNEDKKYVIGVAGYLNLYPEFIAKSEDAQEFKKYAIALHILTSTELASPDLPDMRSFALIAVDEILTADLSHEFGHLLDDRTDLDHLVHYDDGSEPVTDAEIPSQIKELASRFIEGFYIENLAYRLILGWAGLGNLRPNIIVGFLDSLSKQIGAINADREIIIKFFENYTNEKSVKTLERYLRMAGVSQRTCDFNLSRIRNLGDEISGSVNRSLINVNESIETAAYPYTGNESGALELEFNLGPDVPYIYGNAIRLLYVWENLLRNGSEAIEAAGGNRKGKITIKTQKIVTDNQGFVEVSISDNGIGIPPELLQDDRLFEKGVTTKNNGTGLGLYLIRETINDLGGTIVVQSELGKGTTFTIRLPITPQDAQPLVDQDAQAINATPVISAEHPIILPDNFRLPDETQCRILPLTQDIAVERTPEILDLINAVPGSHWDRNRLLEEKPGKWENSFVVIHENGKIIALVLAYPQNPIAELHIGYNHIFIRQLCVDDVFRRQYIATRLLEYLSARLLLQNQPESGRYIALQTSVNNKVSNATYRSLGFDTVATINVDDHQDNIYLTTADKLYTATLNKTKSQDDLPNTNDPTPPATNLQDNDSNMGPSTTGGIDFRILPAVNQAISNLNLSKIPLAVLKNTNLDNELSEIERLVNARIIPSHDRIKEYVQVSCYQRRIIQDKQKVIFCISDSLRQQEESCDVADPILLDILVLLESSRSSDDLRTVFVR